MRKIDKCQVWHHKVAKSLITEGTIKTIAELFYYIPKSSIAKDLGMNYNTFLAKIKDPRRFTIGQLADLADLIEIDPMILIGMVIHPGW